MKLSPIPKMSISFKGITGGFAPEKRVFAGEDTYNYYPFQDETQQEIDTFIKEHSRSKPVYHRPVSYVDDNLVTHVVESGYYTYESKRYVECERLPFTKAEYEQYKNNPEDVPFEVQFIVEQALNHINYERRFN